MEEQESRQQRPSSKRLHGKDDADMKVSKKLTYLLRHGAAKAQLNMKGDGYALLSDVLVKAGLQKSVTHERVLEIVANDEKGRFSTRSDDDGTLWIRANQGHTLDLVDRETLLKKVESADEYPVCIHGTSFEAWNSIKNTGLHRMRRNEIHFAKGHFGTVTSGFRSSSQVLIYMNLALCLEKGIPFYESDNGVLLSPGLGVKGVIPTGFFSKVTTAKSSEDLEFQPSFDVDGPD